MSRAKYENEAAPLPSGLGALPPAVAGLGGVAVLAMGGHTMSTLARSTQPRPRNAVVASAPELGLPETALPETALPETAEAPEAPRPGAATPARPAQPAQPGSRQPGSRQPGPRQPSAGAPAGRTMARAIPSGIIRRGGGAGLPGRIGPIGRISGPLNTSVSGGPVRGPIWNRQPLPGVGAGVMVARALPPTPPVQAVVGVAPRTQPPAGSSDGSSELPDAQKIELSRLANPQAQIRRAPVVKPVEHTTGQPVSVRLSVGRPARGYRVGETVAVRMSAGTNCYALLMRVDANGRTSTLFRSPAPSRTFACVFRAGPSAGQETLIAVASTQPLTDDVVAAAMRGGGGAAAVARTSFATQAAPALITARQTPEKRPTPVEKPPVKPVPAKAVPAEGSIVPKAAPSQPPMVEPPPAKPEQKPVEAPPAKPEPKPETVPAAKPEAPKSAPAEGQAAPESSAAPGTGTE